MDKALKNEVYLAEKETNELWIGGQRDIAESIREKVLELRLGKIAKRFDINYRDLILKIQYENK